MSALPPWLAPLLADASEAAQQDRLGHAVLIHGPAGWGELYLANALALSLLGEDPSRDATTLAHPDLRWLAPESAGAQIKIDEVRALNEFAVQTPQIAGSKAIVVAAAERMNAHAANALLKTLEEPPGACYLLLTTTALAELLPTIRSRCQLLAIRPPATEVAKDWLEAQTLDCSPDEVDGLAFEYGFAAIEVVQAIEREESPLSTDLAALARGQIDPLALAERWARLDVDRLLARWMRYTHAQLTDASVAGVFEGPGEARWQRYFQHLVEARAAVRSPSNPNGRLLLEGLLLEWRNMFAQAV